VRSTVLLVDSQQEHLIVGVAQDFKDTAKLSAVYHRGEGIVGKVLTTGEPVVVHRISDAPEFQSRIFDRPAEWRKTLAFVCVPIRLTSETIGVLSVDDPGLREPAHLTELKDFLEIVARLIAHDVQYRRQLKLARESLERENERLRSMVSHQAQQRKMVGTSEAVQHVQMRIQQVAATQTTVLIRGESGTGKELVASAIHYNSPRACKPFVRVNCAALNENLFESELFGHEKGSFTGASARRIGRMEEAHGGTLFLDEIGEISAAMQAKLLRVLQEKEYERVGGNETLTADVRIIAATNRDLERETQREQFRRDLYFRLAVIILHLPPLRERGSDVVLLARHYLERFNVKYGKQVRQIDPRAEAALQAYPWPGNVRELSHVIERAVLWSRGSVLDAEHLSLTTPSMSEEPAGPAAGGGTGTLEPVTAAAVPAPAAPAEPATLPPPGMDLERWERVMIEQALQACDGNQTRAAQRLGISRDTLRYRLKKYGIQG
jgi:Nif-specific regulatory protein